MSPRGNIGVRRARARRPNPAQPSLLIAPATKADRQLAAVRAGLERMARGRDELIRRAARRRDELIRRAARKLLRTMMEVE
jgi:hypothetical protein